MAVNRSRFRRPQEWDGPRAQRKKPQEGDNGKWKKRFVVMIMVLVVVVLGFGGVIVYGLYQYTDLFHGSDEKPQINVEIDTTAWETVDSKSAKVGFKHPQEWQAVAQEGTSSLDVFNIDVSGESKDGIAGSFGLDVILNRNNLELTQWVEDNGVRGTEMQDATVAEQPARWTRIANESTGEEQNVYYAAAANYIYIIDIYQQATDDVLSATLKEIFNSVTFATAKKSSDTPGKTSVDTSNAKIVISTYEDFDEISEYAVDGADDDLIYDDEDEDLSLAGTGRVAYETGILFGFFGETGSTSNDGLYSIDLKASKPEMAEVVAGVSPEIIRVTPDGSVVAFIDGDRGEKSEIELVDNAGERIATIETEDKVVDFDLADDGQSVAYVGTESGKVVVLDLKGKEIETFDLFDDNVLRFDWLESTSEFAFIGDSDDQISSDSELYYVKGTGSPEQLTDDSYAQSDPPFHPNGSVIFYASFVADSEDEVSIWKIDPDGDNDTNVAKTADNTPLGWIL